MGAPVIILGGTCVTCERNKSLTVSDQTIPPKVLADVFKQLGKAAKTVGKTKPNISGRSSKVAATIGTAAACKNQERIATTAPDITKVCSSIEWFRFG